MRLPLPVIFSAITLLLSVITIIRLWFRHYRNTGQFVFHLAGSLLSVAFLYFMGSWAYISFFARGIFLGLYFIVLVLAIIRRFRAIHRFAGLGPWYNIVFRILFTIAAGILVFFYLDARYYSGPGINLSFPFRHGNYYVMQGGTNRLVNPAHRNFSLSKYGYAMDICKLYPSANRAKGIMPSDVHDYAIFGDTVVSPCSGQVIKVVDTIFTNKPGHYNTRNVHGNHIIIQCRGYRVFLAHFIRNKVFVKEGDNVLPGQPLGLCGNSGFSAEPHLHINVLKNYDLQPYTEDQKLENRAKNRGGGAYNEYVYSGISYPFSFDGKFYIINDIIRKP